MLKIVIMKIPEGIEWNDIEQFLKDKGLTVLYAKVIPRDKRAQITLVDRQDSPLLKQEGESQ